MFRLYFSIFWNGHRSYKENHKPHESPLSMTFPLIFLALLSLFSGLIPFSDYISSDSRPFLTHIDSTVATLSILVALLGIGIAFLLYFNSSPAPARIARSMGIFYKAALHKFYLDEIWSWFTKTLIFQWICEPVKWFDRHIIDGSMNGLAGTTQKTASFIRHLQSGQIQFYAWIFAAGSILIAALVLYL
jgi:NADH-quinone oxidoreductase subunit L